MRDDALVGRVEKQTSLVLVDAVDEYVMLGFVTRIRRRRPCKDGLNTGNKAGVHRRRNKDISFGVSSDAKGRHAVTDGGTLINGVPLCQRRWEMAMHVVHGPVSKLWGYLQAAQVQNCRQTPEMVLHIFVVVTGKLESARITSSLES